MALSPRPISDFVKHFSTLLVMLMLVGSVVSQGFFFQVPQAKASSPGFEQFFEDCTDDDNEVSWVQIKACLNSPGNALVAGRDRTRWDNAIKNKLETFFDNHGTSGPGYELPAAFISKPYVYGSTSPDIATQDRIISAYLSEEYDDPSALLPGSEGMDGAQEIGIFLTSANGGPLCTLLNIPPGGMTVNTSSLPAPYNGLALYGPSRGGDTPRCTRTDILNNDEKPYLIRGFSAALVWVLADIMSTDTVNDEATRTLFAALKTYLETQTPVTANSNQYVDLTNFYAEHFDRDFGNGPIEVMMQACQGDDQVTDANNDEASSQYVTKVAECYTRNMPTETNARAFVNDVLQPATVALATQFQTWNADQQRILRQFMSNDDYLQLAEGYDPLARQKFDYRLSEYLDETINDGYTDDSDWVYDTHDPDHVAASGNAPVGFRSNFDDAAKKPIMYQLLAVNDKLISKASIYLDRPATLAQPPSGQTQGRAAFGAQLARIQRTAFTGRANVFVQMNDYIRRTIDHNKETMLFAWYYMAAYDHDPVYSNPVEHRTGDLSLLVEDKPNEGGWNSTFSDPFLALVTNACSPNKFFDTINKEDFPAWRACLEHEKDYVDQSDTNIRHKPLAPPTENSFTLNLVDSAEPFQIQRSPSVRAAMAQLIQRIDDCNLNPLCLTLNDSDEGRQANADAGAPSSGNNVDTGNAMLNAILSIINVILALLIKFFFWLTALVMSLFQAVLNYTGFTTSSFVVTMWKAIRDFVNLFFILALLGIAIANIVQYEINNYAVKTILPKLILIVLAVNFSRLFVGLVIDATNVIEAGVYQIGGMGPHGAGTALACSQYTPEQVQAGGWKLANIPDDIKQGSVLCRLAQGLRFEEMQRYVVQNNANQPGRQIDFFLANMALFMMVIMLFFGFLALAITFTIRIVVLWALAITSPIYVVSKISPLGSSISGQWQSKFFKYASMHIGVAFFMTLAVLAADSVVPTIFTAAMQQPGSIAGSQLGPAGFQSLADYLKLIFILAMVYAGVFTAAKGDYAQGFIDKVAGLGSPSAIGSYARKGLGIGFGLSQAAGRRLEDVKGNRLGYLARGLGHVLALPSNVGGGVLNIGKDLKKKDEERKMRSQLSAAGYMTGGRFTEMGERFRAELANNRKKIVNEKKEDYLLRYDTRGIETAFRENLRTGNMDHALAAAEALVSKGSNLPLLPENREMLRNAEERKTSTQQAQALIERLEDSYKSAYQNAKEKAAYRLRTGQNKAENQKYLDDAIARLDRGAAFGAMLEGVDDGRLEHGDASGQAMALANLLRAHRNDMDFTPDQRREITKKAKDKISTYATAFDNPNSEANYKERLFQVLQQTMAQYNAHDSVRVRARSFAELERGDSPEDIAEFNRVTELMGQIGTGRVRFRGANDAEGERNTRVQLTDTELGRQMAAKIATDQTNFGKMVMEGDDGAAVDMAQLFNVEYLAKGHTIDGMGNLQGSENVIRESLRGLVENVDNARSAEGRQLNRARLDEYIARYEQNLISPNQRQRYSVLLNDVVNKMAVAAARTQLENQERAAGRTYNRDALTTQQLADLQNLIRQQTTDLDTNNQQVVALRAMVQRAGGAAPAAGAGPGPGPNP